jgi:DNA repair protein RadC
MSQKRQTDKLSIQDLPEEERPRERLLRQGAASLSTAELLALILRTGTASENAVHLSERILSHFDGLGRLTRATVEELKQFHGLGDAKIAQIMAALELGRRAALRPSGERPVIERAADAAELMHDLRDLEQEHVRVILLDSGRGVIATPTVYIGTVNASLLRVSEVFREAITRNSSALIVAHNHPSGDPSPSPEDVEITRALTAAGKLLDVTVVDHIIVARRGWRSMREMGLGF